MNPGIKGHDCQTDKATSATCQAFRALYVLTSTHYSNGCHADNLLNTSFSCPSCPPGIAYKVVISVTSFGGLNFEFLCCLMTLDLRKDIQRHI